MKDQTVKQFHNINESYEPSFSSHGVMLLISKVETHFTSPSLQLATNNLKTQQMHDLFSLTCSKNFFCSSSRVYDSNYDAFSPMTSITHKRHPCQPLLRQPRSTFALFRSLGTSLRRGSTGKFFFGCLFVFVLRPLSFQSRGKLTGLT